MHDHQLDATHCIFLGFVDMDEYPPVDTMSLIRRIEALEKQVQDVDALHKALDGVLSLFVSAHGWDYTCVEAGLAALARNRHRLPVTMALAEKMRSSNE
jgi:hypothetical protein